jgi:hypothetical protein
LSKEKESDVEMRGKDIFWNGNLQNVEHTEVALNAAIWSMVDLIHRDIVYHRKKSAVYTRLTFVTYAGALLAGILGGLCAPLSKVLPQFDLILIGYLLFAIAGGLVAIDQVLGFSSASLRHGATFLELRRIIDRFKVEVLADASALQANPNASEHADRIIELLKKCNDDAIEILLRHSKAWESAIKGSQSALSNFSRPSRGQ